MLRSNHSGPDCRVDQGAPILSAVKLSVGYPGREVLSHLDITVSRGSFVALLGPNGSGKTTLLKTLVGILPPLSGRVIRGETPTGLARLGYVPQRETLDPLFPFSAREVVQMGALGRIGAGRLIPQLERDRVETLLTTLQLQDMGAHPFAELSGGQRQRVLVARALMVDPQILVLDEPTAGVDSAASTGILDLLQELNHKTGLTILIVTHDLSAARKRVPEALWIQGDRVEQGRVEQLLNTDRFTRWMEGH